MALVCGAKRPCRVKGEISTVRKAFICVKRLTGELQSWLWKFIAAFCHWVSLLYLTMISKSFMAPINRFMIGRLFGFLNILLWEI